MKKFLSVLMAAGVFALCTNVPSYAHQNSAPPARQKHHSEMKRPPHQNMQNKRKMEFEQRLNLSEEQKTKSKEIREQGHKDMKPLMDAMRAKHEEKAAIKNSKISTAEQEEQIKKIDSDIAALRKKLHEQKMKNMKDFEAILTKEQKTELQKMKDEGRKNFENKRKKYPQKQKYQGKRGEVKLPVQPPKAEETK